MPIAAYRGFEVTVRRRLAAPIRLGACAALSEPIALEYADCPHTRCGAGDCIRHRALQRLEHLFDALDAELKAAQDGLAREETNLTSYTDQLARPFEHEEALLFAQRT